MREWDLAPTLASLHFCEVACGKGREIFAHVQSCTRLNVMHNINFISVNSKNYFKPLKEHPSYVSYRNNTHLACPYIHISHALCIHLACPYIHISHRYGHARCVYMGMRDVSIWACEMCQSPYCVVAFAKHHWKYGIISHTSPHNLENIHTHLQIYIREYIQREEILGL